MILLSALVWCDATAQGRPVLPAQDRQAHRGEVQDHNQVQRSGQCTTKAKTTVLFLCIVEKD